MSGAAAAAVAVVGTEDDVFDHRVAVLAHPAVCARRPRAASSANGSASRHDSIIINSIIN